MVTNWVTNTVTKLVTDWPMHPVALTKPKNHYTAVHGDGSERVAQVK